MGNGKKITSTRNYFRGFDAKYVKMELKELHDVSSCFRVPKGKTNIPLQLCVWDEELG